MIKSCGKDDFREGNSLVEQLLDDAKTVQSWHLHIQENQIRIVFADEIDRLQPILALRHHVNIANVLEQKCQFVAVQLLVIHDHCG